MIDVLWRLRGAVHVQTPGSDEALVKRLVSMLEKQGASYIRPDRASVRFRSSLFSPKPNWLAMVIYDSGQLSIERSGPEAIVRYDLRSLHGCLFCMTFAVLAAGLTALSGDILYGLRIGALMFAWLYGMNILLALVRVPGLIRRSAQGA